jgi:hypothetical protein
MPRDRPVGVRSRPWQTIMVVSGALAVIANSTLQNVGSVAAIVGGTIAALVFLAGAFRWVRNWWRLREPVAVSCERVTGGEVVAGAIHAAADSQARVWLRLEARYEVTLDKITVKLQGEADGHPEVVSQSPPVVSRERPYAQGETVVRDVVFNCGSPWSGQLFVRYAARMPGSGAFTFRTWTMLVQVREQETPDE